MEKATTVRHGTPCSPKSLKEHLKAFSDIEEAIEELYKADRKKKKGYNKK